MLYLVEFLLVGLGLALAYKSEFDGGTSIERPTSHDASISNIFKRSKRAAPDLVYSGSSFTNYQYGDSSDSNVLQNVHNHGSGNMRVIYGDCSGSSITTYVKSYGSGDIHFIYGNRPQMSYPSTAGVQSNTYNYGEWPRNIDDHGSGDIDVVFGNCRSASSRVMQNVYLHGSGDMRIIYGKSTTSEVDHDIYIAGSGDVFFEYDNCNGGEESDRNINIVGSGKVYTKCGNQRAHLGWN